MVTHFFYFEGYFSSILKVIFFYVEGYCFYAKFDRKLSSISLVMHFFGGLFLLKSIVYITFVFIFCFRFRIICIGNVPQLFKVVCPLISSDILTISLFQVITVLISNFSFLHSKNVYHVCGQ